MWDVVVLGLGGVGSFALRAVAQSSDSVLGVEQFQRGHDKGSSHGQSRIYRKAYFEHPNYVPWIEYSLQEFQKLQETFTASSSPSIVMPSGVLLMVPRENRHLLDAALATAKQHQIPVQVLEGDDLQARFPQFNYAHKSKDGGTIPMLGLYEPGGGVIRPENAIHAALQDAEAHGAQIWEDSKVLSLREIHSKESGTKCIELVIKRTTNNTIDGQTTATAQHTTTTIYARKVLLTAGPWTGDVLREWKPHLQTTRQLQTWVDISAMPSPHLYDGSTHKMPALGAILPGIDQPVYALPADLSQSSYRSNSYAACIKLGIHARPCPVDPSQNHSTRVTPDEEAELKSAIQATFGNDLGELPLHQTRPCLYTMTADEHFVIGNPSSMSSNCLFVVAGLSGHGFKMVPALGQIMADFALDRDLTKWNLDFCDPSRFGI